MISTHDFLHRATKDIVRFFFLNILKIICTKEFLQKADLPTPLAKCLPMQAKLEELGVSPTFGYTHMNPANARKET